MFDEKFLTLLLLFFPGIVGVLFINYVLESYKKLEINLFLLYSFALGVVSYLPTNFFCEDSNIFELRVSTKALILATIFEKNKIITNNGKKVYFKKYCSFKRS